MSPLILFTLKTIYSAVLGFVLGIQREKIGKPPVHALMPLLL